MNTKTQTAILAITMMLIGIALAIGGTGFLTNAFEVIVTIIGVFLIAFGIVCFVSHVFPMGAICLAVGLLIVIFAWTLVWIAFLALGVSLLTLGILGLIRHAGWILVNIIGLVIGIAIVFLSFGINFAWAKSVMQILSILCGVALFVDGVLLLAKHG